MDTPADSWPFIKSSQILWQGQHVDMNFCVQHVSNMHLQVVTKTNISCAVCVVATCDYLCHGPVGLLHPALRHLQTSYELKGVCYLSTQVTKYRSLCCKRSSLDLHTSLQWEPLLLSRWNKSPDNDKLWGCFHGATLWTIHLWIMIFQNCLNKNIRTVWHSLLRGNHCSDIVSLFLRMHMIASVYVCVM